MLFVILDSIIMILLLLLVIRWIIGLGLIFAVFVDMIVLAGFAIYYAHKKWFVHIASGNAVYFWDILLFVGVSLVYGVIVTRGTSSFPRIAGVFHFIVAWVTTGIIYGVINYDMYDGELGPLLNNAQMNVVVHLIIISILATFIFRKRIRVFTR